MEIKGKDYIHGDDEDIIAEMKQVEAELNDRIDEVRSTANTAGLDPALARTLYDRLNQATTHLSSGADTAMHNIAAARERMAISEQGAGRVNSINTSIGSGPAMPQAVTQGRNYASGISQHQQVRPTGVQRTRQAGPVSAGRGPAPQQVTQPRATAHYTPQPTQTRTSAGGYAPQAPAQPAPRMDHTIPSTPMRNGAFVPPVPSGMPSDYAARLAERQAQAQQATQAADAARAQREQARQAQRAQVEQQREKQQQLLANQRAEREAEMEKRTAELEKQREEQQQALADKQADREAAREQAVREAEERAAEREAEREAKVAKAERDERLQEVLKEWRNEVSQMDAEHQEQVLDEAGDTVSREEAVKIIEEALGDYYANEAPPVDGVDPVAADGGAYAGGGALPPAGSIGMAEGDVSFANVNMGVMDEATTAAYIEDALDLNGWTADPNVRAQVHNLMYNMSQHESGGNPNAANGWDSNAIGPVQSDGFPYQSSRGPWQTIPQTFAAYHVEGTSNSIYDPQASAAAALAYMMDRYGFDPQTGAGVAEFGARRGIDVNSGQSSGAYIGY